MCWLALSEVYFFRSGLKTKNRLANHEWLTSMLSRDLAKFTPKGVIEFESSRSFGALQLYWIVNYSFCAWNYHSSGKASLTKMFKFLHRSHGRSAEAHIKDKQGKEVFEFKKVRLRIWLLCKLLWKGFYIRHVLTIDFVPRLWSMAFRTNQAPLLTTQSCHSSPLEPAMAIWRCILCR